MFSIGKNRISNPLGIEYLYWLHRLFDILPKQTTYEMKRPSSKSLHTVIISW